MKIVLILFSMCATLNAFAASPCTVSDDGYISLFSKPVSCGAEPSLLSRFDYSDIPLEGYLTRKQAIDKIEQSVKYFEQNGTCKPLPRDANGKLIVVVPFL